MTVKHNVPYGSWAATEVTDSLSQYEGTVRVAHSFSGKAKNDVGVFLSIRMSSGAEASIIISFDDWQEIVKAQAVQEIANILGVTADDVEGL